MENTAAFLDALKRSLKAKGITYRNLATRLDLSEASVKRVFAEGSLSLDRIGIILDALEMSFLDIAKLARPKGIDDGDTLTFDQESVLAADVKLLSFFHLLLFGSSPEEIHAMYELSSRDAERYVRTLADLGLVKQRPNGTIKTLKSRNIRWRDDGPLRAAFGKKIRDDFLARAFDGEREMMTFRTRSLTASSQALLKRRMEQILGELDSLSGVDTAAVKSQTRPVALLVAFGPFSSSAVAGLKRRRRD